MHDKGLISVVLCTYNGSRFIDQQLNSIHNQTYTHLEIIISDDASTDNTFELLEKHAAGDKRIRLYKNEKNLGFNLNFDKACSLTTGEFIAFSDQDDIWHPEKLQRIKELWKSDVQLMYCNSIRFSGKTPPPYARADPAYKRFEGTDSRKLSVFNTVSGHAILIKKSLLPLITPFPADIFYDWRTAVVAACNGGVGYVDEILVFQRIHGSNESMGSTFDYSDKKNKPHFNELVRKHAAVFSGAANMPAGHIQYYITFSKLWSAAMKKRFSWPLFFFLLKNRKPVFNHKKKKRSFFSYLKHCYLLTVN